MSLSCKLWIICQFFLKKHIIMISLSWLFEIWLLLLIIIMIFLFFIYFRINFCDKYDRYLSWLFEIWLFLLIIIMILFILSYILELIFVIGLRDFKKLNMKKIKNKTSLRWKIVKIRYFNFINRLKLLSLFRFFFISMCLFKIC